MKNQWFAGLSGVEEIKAAYRKLAMQHHPDRGGDVETMKALNIAYQAALADMDGCTSKGTDGKEHTYRYNEDIETEIMEKINAVLEIGIADVEVMLIGTWIWISGDTKPHRAELKSLKAKWHGRRRCWYWHPPTKRRTRPNPGGLEAIASKYGYRVFDEESTASSPGQQQALGI